MHASTLRPVALPAHLIGRPAPCDIFDARGTLLQKSGSPIARHADHVLRPHRIFCEASKADDISSTNPIAQLRATGQALAHLAEHVECGRYVAAGELTGLALAVSDLWQLDADACIGYARLDRSDRPSVCHAVLAALIAAELAAANGSPRESIRQLIGAALTMNLGSMARHDEMFATPDFSLRMAGGEHRAHPARSAELLESIGDFPEEWLRAVAQHHENVDGTGYPRGLKRAEISLPARMLRIADALAGKLIGRKRRPPQHWNILQTRDTPHLVQHVFGTDLARLDQALVRQLMTRLSAFPPGSLVRLSSGELAVVNRRRSESNSSPREALAFLDCHGGVFEAPRVRLIGTRDCRIHSYVHDELHKLPPYEWQQIWGYK